MKQPSEAEIKQLAATISQALRQEGVEAVLTGDACVSIYSKNRYQSGDLDFVTAAVEDIPRRLVQAMAAVGFHKTSSGYFENPKTPYFVEFIPPPLAVGREPIHHPDIMKTDHGHFKLLSPTDCVKDRLAAFYHWGDRRSLEQASLVAQNHPIHWKEVERWSVGEGKKKLYKDFLQFHKKNWMI